MSERLLVRGGLLALVGGVVLALAGPRSGHAQADGDSASSASTAMEEVVVRGRRSMRQLYNEAARATERYYELLNAHLDDKEMRVTCQRETRRNSLIRERVCRTGFQQTEMSRQGRSQVDSLLAADGDLDAFIGTTYDPVPALTEKQIQFDAKVMEAVNTDPELNRAVLALMELKREIELRERGDRR